MHAANVTDTAAQVVAAGNRDFVHIRNFDESEYVYVKYDGSSTALTTTNGFPIPPMGMLVLENVGPKKIHDKAIYAIAATGKTVEIRIQGAAEP